MVRTRIDCCRLHLRLLLELLIVDRSLQLIVSLLLLENAADHVSLRLSQIIAVSTNNRINLRWVLIDRVHMPTDRCRSQASLFLASI